MPEIPLRSPFAPVTGWVARLLLIAGLACACLGRPLLAQTAGVLDGMTVQADGSLVSLGLGDLPILLTAPHGGRQAIPGVPTRTGTGKKSHSNLTDTNTARLTEAIAAAIEAETGKRPFTVIARFHRKYVDANRSPANAFEHGKAEAHYVGYHQAIGDARQEVIRRWGGGILIDIHGQSASLDVIFRGTAKGSSMAHLVEKFGEEALIGKTSLFGQLAAQGFQVMPPVDSHAGEDSRYGGGFTTRAYGSRSGGVMDAIQLELGKNLRLSKALPKTAEGVARAVLAFSAAYLPKEERKITVGVYRDVGAGSSVKHVLRALGTFDDVTAREVTAAQIRSGGLKGLDVLLQPGGSGGKQGRHLGEEGRQAIRDFVTEGGGYVGICAGAYLASADYPWSLHILDAKVIDRKHWARGKGTVRMQLTPKGQRVLKSAASTIDIHYGQGPLLGPLGKDEIPDYEVLAAFGTEIAKKGAPKGVMVGTTAAAAGRFGSGRVVCFSPHPELTAGLDQLLRCGIHEVAFVRDRHGRIEASPPKHR